MNDPNFFGQYNNLYTIIGSIFNIKENYVGTYLSTTEKTIVSLIRKIRYKWGFSSRLDTDSLYFYIPFHIFKINNGYYEIETPNNVFISIITEQINNKLIVEFWNEIKFELE